MRKPKPVQSSFAQRLFAAAFSSTEDGAFEAACAREIKAATNAVHVLLSLNEEGAGVAQFQAGTAPTSKPMKARGKSATNGTARKSIMLPLVSACRTQLGEVHLSFDGSPNLAKQKAAFQKLIAPSVCTALLARRATGKVIAPNQFGSLATTIPGVVYQRIVRMDGDIRYTYLSEGAREMFGVEPKDVIADPDVLFRTFTDEYRKTFRQRLVAASKTLTKWDVEATIDLPSGAKRTTHAIARPEPLPDGSVLWTGVILDASRAKEAEENLKTANRMVGLANQAKSAFLAKMSHEMRTPLNGVLGMADLLLKTELSPRQTRLATTLCDSAKSLLGIINDVLDLSRIEAGQFKLDPQDFNLRHCIEDAMELCSTAAYKKGLEVNLIIAPGVPIGVKSDPVRLRQVLINLVGNAIKFTEAGEVLVRMRPVNLSDQSNAIVFEVQDTGIGIDKDAIKRLFEPFAQADQTISRRFGGTGLGLSITRHLVQALGGLIEMESEKGKGTTVRFTIPFDVVANGSTPSVLSQVSLAGARVLLVDDRPTTREMLASNLAELGIETVVAASESEALSLMTDAYNAGNSYDAIIVDRVRPRMSGLHLCRTLRMNPKLMDVPAVALMSTNWVANPIDQQGLGRTLLLSKPVRRTDLLSALTRLRDPMAALEPSKSEIGEAGLKTHRGAPSLKLRVLLVEDNLTNIEVAREYLNELDCRVTVAMNGIEGIAAYDRANFDIILMDSQMPELDGLSATRRIRESERRSGRKRIPIISVTANAYESDRVQAIDAGSDEFLSKPYTDMQLRAVLQRWGVDAAQTSSSQVPAVAQNQLSLPSAAHGPVAAEPSSDHLDAALHSVLMKSRPQFLQRLVRAYLASVPEARASLTAAVSQADPELLRGVAHSLKSSSANVGAKRLSELCRTLEMQVRLGSEVAACERLAADISTELSHTEKALEQVLCSISAGENAASVRVG